MPDRFSHLWPLVAAPLIALGCAAEPDALDTVESALTSIIPASDRCNEGLLPGQCVSVPPVETASTSAWVVDGTHTPGEYLSAVELPFTTDTAYTKTTVATTPLRRHGKVYVQQVTQTGLSKRHYLYVFLEDIPVPVTTSIQSTVAVHLDLERFNGADGIVASEDRRYLVDLAAGGTMSMQVPTTFNGSTFWTNSSSLVIGQSYAPGGCRLSASSKYALCNGELRIPLPAAALASPGEGEDGRPLDPGIGFFVRHPNVTQASAPAVDPSLYASSTTRRSTWPTLLFGKPRGFDLSVMSWNMRRYDPFMESLMLSDFGGVVTDTFGAYIYKHDIIAVQEGWERDHMADIVEYANWLRDAEGLPKFKLYGPIDFEHSRSSVLTTVVENLSDTHGGLWVISHLPLANKGYRVFADNTCRGEDCLKAKGVQWVRLMLQDPGALDPECAKNVAKSCDKLPSGDDYVDIFNTHLQATDPMLCTMADWSAMKVAILAGLAVISPALAIAAEAVIQLISHDLNCNAITDVLGRGQQLAAINEFIKQTTGSNADRPVLVMGDFNVNGKFIHESEAGAEYRSMLFALGLAESTQPGDPMSDEISPAPGTWDIEHGDIARELDDVIDFFSGDCLGTAIGEKDGWIASTCDLSGESDAKERLDYIFVRPPALPSKVTKYPRWYVVPGPKVWRSPFPSISGQFAYSPPLRLSDHKPIVSDLTFARLKHPPAYNPTWPHDVITRIVGVDGTGVDDCIGCGEIDPFAHIVRTTEPANETSGTITSECTGIQAPSYGNDTCMNNWFGTAKHVPPADQAVRLEAWIRDADNSSANDTLDEGTTSRFVYDGGNGIGVFHTSSTFGGVAFPDEPWPNYEAVSMSKCTGIFYLGVCHGITLTERPPSP